LYTVNEIAGIIGGAVKGEGSVIISAFLTDSRAIRPSEGTMFIALRTGRNDGHRYIEELVARGVAAFLVLDDYDTREYQEKGVSFICTGNTLAALHKLATHHRERFRIPVIGITGSNGKTTVKEWLYHLLKPDYSICRSPKSYNSQIGVPLSVLSLRPEHNLAIFEAGISRVGEMERLQPIIKPSVGVFTSLGSAHDEGFSDRGEKLREKLKLFAGCETVILNDVNPEEAADLKAAKKYFLGFERNEGISYAFADGELKMNWNGKTESFSLAFDDKASVQNAATCIATMFHLGYSAERIRERLGSLTPLAIRLETRRGVMNSWVINDYYNSDLDSLEIALDHLRRQSRQERKVVIMSDLEQSGMTPEKLYLRISQLLEKHQVQLLIGIGKEISRHSHLFDSTSKFYESTADFVLVFNGERELLRDSTVLLKGARSFGFEHIDRLLQLKTHNTVFEINLANMVSNINYYRSLTGGEVKFMCMVKATGYGSGAAEIAGTLQHIGVQYLAVAYADEGVELREARINLPVMVMSPEENAMEDIVNYRLEPEIYSFRVLEQFVSCVDRMGITEAWPVHIKIDTGMHRLGFGEKDIPELASRLTGYSQVKVHSVFTHLAGADSPELDEFTLSQLSIFNTATEYLQKSLGYTFMRHACNSAGISRFPSAHFDMVRLGIGMYGISADETEQRWLHCAGALRTRISQIKELSSENTVGYNRSGRLTRPTRVATIPLGYADGFSRQLGNGRHGVYVKGKLCPTIGSICMDMCMVDVTGVNCAEGDEVLIFETAAQVKAMAKAANTISYEILTNVSARVKRIYVEE
jgi:Alr-MurF fusion protein